MNSLFVSLLDDSFNIYLTRDEAFDLLNSKSNNWYSIGRYMEIPQNFRDGLRHDKSLNHDDKLEIVIDKWFTSSKTKVTRKKLICILEKLKYQDVIRRMNEDDEWKGIIVKPHMYTFKMYLLLLSIEKENHDISQEIFSQSGIPWAFFPISCGCNNCTVRGWRTKTHCQHYFEDMRPKLLAINPAYRDPQITQLVRFETDYDRQLRLCIETSRITQEFDRLREITWRELIQGVQQNTLSMNDIEFECTIKLGNSFLEISSCNSLSELLHRLGTSWFNFTLLQHLAEKFLSKQTSLITDWRNYSEHFVDYCTSRNLSEYTNVFFKTTNSEHVFLIEVDELYYDFTLNDVINLQKTLSKVLCVPFISLHLLTVGKASLVIYFHYCYSDYLKVFSSLTQEQLKMISESYKIVSIVDIRNRFKYSCIDEEKEVLEPEVSA